MATEIEYALMAGAAYISTRPNNKNKFPVPTGWDVLSGSHVSDSSTGFEVVSFKNTDGTKIVISFAGTDPEDGDDVAACFGLGVGNGSIHLKQAAEYYLQIKAANKNAEITFTGHSLGGGLAALLSVFFNVQAVTFDEAPFRASAKGSVRDALKEYLTTSHDGNPAAFDLATLQSLAPDFFTFAEENLGQRTGNITGKYVEGEFLEEDWPYSSLSRIGNPECIPLVARGASGKDLHAQSLLTAFLANPGFQAVASKLKDLTAQIFDDDLYCFDTDEDRENFIDRLIRHEFGNAPEATDSDMLKRFTEDLEKIAKDGGLSLTDDNMKKTLTAFAMQMYYTDESNSEANRHLFNTDGITDNGGIHFKIDDVAASLTEAKGYNLYFDDYLNTWNPEEKAAALSQLPGLEDWYVQAGGPALKAKAGDDRAFMIGGDNGDELTGGGADDVLYGGKGQDKLTGGAGDDLLIGGEGADSYYFHLADGSDTDTIIDSGKNNTIYAQRSSSGKMTIVKNVFGTDNNQYNTIDGEVIVTRNSNRLDLPNGSHLDLPLSIEDFGINLIDIPENPIISMSISGDLAPVDFDPNMPGVQTQKDAWDNIITEPGSSDPNRADILFDTTGNDKIDGGGGDDYIRAFRGGDEWFKGGEGSDIIDSWNDNEAGVEIMEGGAGADLLWAGAGSDWVFGENLGEMKALIADGEIALGTGVKGDLASGGTGNDFVYGSAENDALFGGMVKSFLSA